MSYVCGFYTTFRSHGGFDIVVVAHASSRFLAGAGSSDDGEKG